MSKIITVEALSKRYRLGSVGAASLREEFSALSQRILGKNSNKPSKRDFWALREVSFEVEEGNVMGVIGRNGAGKSTLLKILSRITEPTSGTALLKGRMASLLEVGTGFHPELSGRDNIYLSGTIMGLKRWQIRERFDQIVAFAEVEKFLDTPVKRYSSGMYVRLGFSIAAFLNPEILIIDEVLAVGDQRFQQRCLGKMREVSREEGRTVLFVSHNLGMVQSLCQRCIFLEEGRIKANGDSFSVVQQYLKTSGDSNTRLEDRKDRSGSGVVKFTEYQLRDGEGNAIGACPSGHTCVLELAYAGEPNEALDKVDVGFAVKSDTSDNLLLYRSHFEGVHFNLSDGKGLITCRIGALPLCEGRYTCEIFLFERRLGFLDVLESAFTLEVLQGDFFGTGLKGNPNQCKVLARSEWAKRSS